MDSEVPETEAEYCSECTNMLVICPDCWEDTYCPLCRECLKKNNCVMLEDFIYPEFPDSSKK